MLRYILPSAIPVIRRATLVGGPSRSPVVLLLGWGGSKPKNLSKLQSYYESRGSDSVVFCMPLFIPAFLRRSLEDGVVSILRSISGDRSVHIHLYSNNGTWTYAALVQRPDMPKVDKVVWDSAPYLNYEAPAASLEAAALSRVFTSVLLGRPQYTHPIISPLSQSLLFIFVSLSRALSRLPILGRALVPDLLGYNIYLRDLSPPIPHLFIYSSGDKLLPKQNVQEYIALLRKRQVPIEEVEFGDDVPHTASFYKYPEVYSQYIDNFFGLRKPRSEP